MKKILFIALFLLPCLIFAQTKVAVYVTSTDKVPKETKKVVGSEVTAAFVATEQYSAIERTSEFLAGISTEQEYQRGGSVDDSQICELGRQFGVDLVCVADITIYNGEYYIQARLIDVEKAIVLATAREISSLEDLDTVIKISENLAQKLISTTVTYTLSIENSRGALDIYIAGEYVGQAAARSITTFKVPLNLTGKLEAKSASGLFKRKEDFIIPKVKALEIVNVTF
ncbi:MAG: hypothetical protein MJZ70_08440 [Bacteroidales bacterium]|nr:hypothetical protein [Bacteroidales bacterium]